MPNAPISPSPACFAIIKEFEGCRLTAYPDPATKSDPWTIGIGHTGPEVHKGLVWTQAQCDAALASDLVRFASTLRALLMQAKTTQAQCDAMISLMFNIGPAKFAKSSVLANHKLGRYDIAAQAFLLWNKAAGKVMDGLARRRTAEAALYLT